jgi:hypothetical protein
MITAMIVVPLSFRRFLRGPSSTVTVVRIRRLISGANVLHPSVTVKGLPCPNAWPNSW